LGRLLFSLSSLSFVGYAIGFVNQIIIANKFGTSAELDIYLLALSVVNFGWFFIGPINEISIPNFFQQAKNSTQAGSEYFSKVLNIILVFSAILSILIYVLLPTIFQYVSSGVNIDYNQFQENVLFLLPIIFLTAITQFFQAILNSMSKYIAQSIGKVVTASISVIFLLLFFDYLGIKAIIFAMELGLVVLSLLQFYFIFKLNIHYKPFGGIIGDKTYYKHMLALSFTYLLSAIQLVYERFVFISFGDGVLSSYNYSQALLQVPQMIVVTGVVAIVWTNFMNKIYENDIDRGLDELFIIAFNSFIIAMFVAVTISIFSKEIVYILFYRGEFDMHSLEKTSYILYVLIYAFPFLVFSSVIGRALVALKKIKILLKINISTSIVLILLLFISYKLENMLLSLFVIVLVHFLVVLYKLNIYSKFYKNQSDILKKSFISGIQTAGIILIYIFIISILKDLINIDVNTEKIKLLIKLFLIGIIMIGSIFLFLKFKNEGRKR
jgi:putative peptidoglycan lipid II flippase